jgi:hypothetical protein
LDTLATSLGDGKFHRALASLALACTEPGDHIESIEAAASAAQTFTSHGYLPYAARANYRLGIAYQAAEQPGAARQAIRMAADMFDECGSVARRDRSVGWLVHCGASEVDGPSLIRR